MEKEKQEKTISLEKFESMEEQIKELTKEVKRYKELDLEGDGLYEKKIAECEDLQKQLEMKQKKIGQLKACVHELMVIKSNFEFEILQNKALIDEMEKEIENLSQPWWKKIF